MSTGSMQRPTGWLKDQEDTDFLHNGGVSFSEASLLFGAPAEFLTDSIIVVENQGNMSSCTGHGVSSGSEACGWVASGQQPAVAPKQFAPMYAYLSGQEQCGMLGRDQGATIAGAVKGATLGNCPKELFPYPSHYISSFPAGTKAAAAKFTIKSHSNLTSPSAVLNYQQQGLGAVVIGITWTNALSNCTGVIKAQDVKGNGGGHCVLLWGWDAQGRIRLHNSWGTSWGQGGRAWVEQGALENWFNLGAEFIGISDLSGTDVQRPMADYTQIV